jgi:hypothetical protein
LSTLLSSLAAPNPTSAAGSTVEEAFRSHLANLAAPAPGPAKTPANIPSLYMTLRSFWLPSSPAYFSLTASASTSRTPSEFRFLYWDPQPLVFNGIACPYCASPLANNARIRSGPIKVYDIGRQPFFVIACEYACEGAQCGRTFSSVDRSILQALPEKLREEFPAVLLHAGADLGSGANIWCWRAMGVSKDLWNLVQGCLRAGAGKDTIMQIIKGIQDGVPDEWSGQKEEAEESENEANHSQEVKQFATPRAVTEDAEGSPEASTLVAKWFCQS